MTILATHYRELTNLENDEIKNFKMPSRHRNGKLHFTYEVTRGVAEKSFGVDVTEQ